MKTFPKYIMCQSLSFGNIKATNIHLQKAGAEVEKKAQK